MPAGSASSEFFLVVRFWVAPDAHAAVRRWLEGGHVAEVLAQPGFLWCRRLKLEPREGWAGYAMIYGIASRAAYEAYEANQSLKQKFARERAPFENRMRIERFAGEVDFSWE